MSNSNPTEEQLFSHGPLMLHLREFRRRMLLCLMIVCALFLGLIYFANDIYYFLSSPLLKQLPATSTMIATAIASPFLAPMKLTLILSFFISIPFILYHLWAFIAPGLYKNEKNIVWPLLVTSSLLFYVGMAFAYYIVFPLVFGFFTQVAPEGVAVMPDISQYLHFAVKLFFAFGLAFEVPIAVFILMRAGICTHESLAAKRSYIIVMAFVAGMLLTPPDVVSQILLALPIWALFELGLLLGRYFTPSKRPK